MSSILFDCERMKYPNTGPYNVCLRLGQELIRLQTPNDSLSFLTDPKAPEPFGENQHYYRLGLKNKIYLPWEKSRFLTNTRQFDLWHSTYQSTMYLPLNKKTKVVLTILDLNFLHEHPDNPKNQKYLSLIQNRIDRADHVVGISHFGLNDVRQHLRLDKPASVIYLGAEFNAAAVVEPALVPARPFLFCLGTIIPKKNFHVLPCLLKGNEYDLVIAGISSSSYKEVILEEARKFNVADRVHFTGPVAEAQKQWYYQHCLAFCFPSIAEGFGIPPIEAMTHGKPVFLSTSTSLPEVGGDNAYYFHDFWPDSMQEVFADGMRDFAQKNPSEKIKKWAAQFNWENTARSYLRLYNEVLSS